MIKNVKIGKVVLDLSAYAPGFLQPLLRAVEVQEPLEPVLTTIVEKLGFETFMFGMSASPELSHESQNYVYTTLPIEWVTRYDQMDYVEIDPRLLKTRDSSLPFVWDQQSERGHHAKTDAFLDDAAAHGMSSGLAIEFKDTHFVRGLMALGSANPVIDDERRAAISQNLGDILVLGTYFHEIFRKGVVEQDVAPLGRGGPLSRRQRECLSLAAHGLTTEDIASTLGISARTAQYHFDSIRTKMGAATRQEAVAMGIAQGMISI
jgi:DNA-binding CsgD family transcriptional regulator